MRTRETVSETFGSRGESVSVQRSRLPAKVDVEDALERRQISGERRPQALDERQDRRVGGEIQHVGAALAFDGELIPIEHQLLGPRFDRAFLEPIRCVVGHHPDRIPPAA